MIDFDRTASTISGAIDVSAGSGNSGNQSRDKKMTNEVLDATHFAESRSCRTTTREPSPPREIRRFR